MFKKIVVVCVGNICRSPLGERLLRSKLPDLQITSAGIGALVGHAADEDAAAVAEARGIDLSGHSARQFDANIGADNDLILVMEPGHKTRISSEYPQVSGKVMLFDQWTGGEGIPDPYRRSREFHEHVHDLVTKAAEAWAARLGGPKG